MSEQETKESNQWIEMAERGKEIAFAEAANQARRRAELWHTTTPEAACLCAFAQWLDDKAEEANGKWQSAQGKS